MVPGVGLEPTHHLWRGILNPTTKPSVYAASWTVFGASNLRFSPGVMFYCANSESPIHSLGLRVVNSSRTLNASAARGSIVFSRTWRIS